MNESDVRALFARYERLFNQALAGEADMDAVASLYSSEVIGAAPTGVRTGRNDDTFKEVMAEGYANYRAMGTREMRLRDVQTHPIDHYHCLARVAWTAIYAREDASDKAIDFDVHYLVQQLDGGEAKVFGWVTGDEQALLKEHGII